MLQMPTYRQKPKKSSSQFKYAVCVICIWNLVGGKSENSFKLNLNRDFSFFVSALTS